MVDPAMLKRSQVNKPPWWQRHTFPAAVWVEKLARWHYFSFAFRAAKACASPRFECSALFLKRPIEKRCLSRTSRDFRPLPA